MKTENVSAYFQTLKSELPLIDTYKRYWETLIPADNLSYLLRWVFAFMSVRSQWKANVYGYLLAEKLIRNNEIDTILQEFEKNGIGLIKMRGKGIRKFYDDFKAKPNDWYLQNNETLAECRERLIKHTFGIKMAKVSFALEMCYPFNQDVVCLDTHMLKLYEMSAGTPNKIQYLDIESDWCNRCKQINIPSPIARHIYWDKKQGYLDTRYWSYVFERNRPKVSPNNRRAA